MIKRLVIGSKNSAKLDEWYEFLKDFSEIHKLPDLGVFEDAIEYADNFMDNAKMKAAHYAKLTGEYVFAEDGGFEVEALGGRPGVKSRRILPNDMEATDEEAVEFILNSMKNIPAEKRSAKLTAAAAVSDPNGNIIFTAFNSLEGVVVEAVEKVTISGYPYRDLLFIPQAGKTYAQISKEEHEKFNHKKSIAKKVGEILRRL